MPRLKNIDYNGTTNTTTVYGHTNFEEVKVNNKAVALAEDIPDVSGKANVNHAHKTDDITRDVTTVNEEEEEVTEAVALNDILDGKAEAEHTHTLSEITDYTAYDDSNCAKLNANNTFTAVQTINNTGNGSNQTPFKIMCPNLPSNGRVSYFIGKSESKNQCAVIRYFNASTPYYGIGFYNNDDIVKIDTSKNVTINGPLTTSGVITANGININTTLAGKADSNHNHDSTYAALSHTHKTDDITRDVTTVNEEEEEVTEAVSLNDILDGKAESEHTHIISDVTGLQTALDGKASSSHNHDSTYAGINHNHDSTYAGINHNHDSSYAAINHAHAISDITNLQTALDGKASSSHNHDSSYAGINHNHDSTYAAIGHDHDSSYSPINHDHDTSYSAIGHNHDSTYAALSHSHAISDITNLQTTLDGKASSSHNHDSTYDAINHNHDSTYAGINHNHDSTYAALSHTHNFSDIKTMKGKTIRYLSGDDITLTNLSRIDERNVCFDLNINRDILECNGTIEVSCDCTYQNSTSGRILEQTFVIPIIYSVYRNNQNQKVWSIYFDLEATNYYSIYRTTTGDVNLSAGYESSEPVTDIHIRINRNIHTFVSIDSCSYTTTLRCMDYETVTNNDNTNDIEALSQLILKRIYPIGSLYTSMNLINPNVLLGFGTWTPIVDRFLYCANSSGTTGGEATHTLTVDEMPSHQHGLPTWSDNTRPTYHRFEYYNQPTNFGTVLSESTGGGQPHNNMPPYMTVYAWQRTA